MRWEESQHPRDERGRFRDRTGGWAAAMLGRLGFGAVDELEHTVTSGREVGHRGLGGGVGSSTLFIDFELPDGSTRTLIRKRYTVETPRETAAEVVSGWIGQAIGAPVPAIVRAPLPDDRGDSQSQVDRYYAERTVYMEPLDGRPFGEATPDRIDSLDGRLIGLLDLLVVNKDRHPGNWLVLSDGSIAGIDHGIVDLDQSATSLEGAARWPRNDFTEHYLEYRPRRDGALRDNDWHPDDLAAIEWRLLALFATERWQQWAPLAGADEAAILGRLDAIRAKARGTVRRLA